MTITILAHPNTGMTMTDDATPCVISTPPGRTRTGEIGEHHTPETHLIPLLLRAAQDPKALVSIHGTDYPIPHGTCIRDFIHVVDLADGRLRALAPLAHGTGTAAYNRAPVAAPLGAQNHRRGMPTDRPGHPPSPQARFAPAT